MIAISTQELTKEKIQQAVDLILDKMPPQTELHHEALAEFRNGSYANVKKLAMSNPLDPYSKALSFLGGAFNPQAIASGNSYTIIHESLLKAGEFAKELTVSQLGSDIAKVFD
ncbi:hypothetical protein FD723_40655 (plasmid) [Nostoc sp. C052]|uniref:hypothetical protein n=1 Tax=Nostoc sp. C052 TaxID=2576902 RepID=UPI0015C36AB9|nr:hypothetical protein [Nostoc sp. C052]QLE46526.1 hypothetical protein FD723_40655 [Nostoc sp. C052]